MPGVEVALDPEPPLVQEAIAMSFHRRADPPVFRWGELSDELVLGEKPHDMFAHATGYKRLYGRSFPLDLEGGMVDGLLGHSGVIWGDKSTNGVDRELLQLASLRLAAASCEVVGV